MFNNITENSIGAAIEVHRFLGPRLLESAHQECLCFALIEMGYTVQKEISQPVTYKDIKLNHGYGIELLVEHKIVIELSH